MRARACAVTFGAHLIEPIFALALPQRDLDAPAPHAAGQIMEKADSAFDRLVFRNPAPRAGSRIGDAAADQIDIGLDPRALDPEDRRQRQRRIHRERSEEHTSELQSLMRISYAVFCL